MRRFTACRDLMRRFRALVCLSVFTLVLANPFVTDSGRYILGPTTLAPSEAAVRSKVNSVYDHLPLAIEANHGQFDPEVRFFSRGKAFNLFLESSKAILTVPSDKNRNVDHSLRSEAVGHFLSLELKGANPAPEIIGEQRLQSLSHFVGSNPQHWITP